jgi:flavin reductase ActVB
MKLLCIPCGDAPASSLRSLATALGPAVEVVTIEPAGPGDRDHDRPYEMSDEAVDDVAARIARHLDGASYAVHGCCTGALIGYEAVRRLVTGGHPSPRHLFVSAGTRSRGHRGQDGNAGEHTRHDLMFLAALGIGPDRERYSRYREAGRAPLLGCPVTVFTGDGAAGDPEPDAGLWAGLTSGPVTGLLVTGGPHAPTDSGAVGIAERMRTVLLGDDDAPSASSAMSAPAVTAEVFREAMAHLASPVTVVTAMGDNGEPRGFTASAVCSLSADPPLLLVCMNRTGSTHDVFATACHFLVNVLTDEQTDVATAFARHGRAEAEAGLVPLERGVPGVPGASARFLCAREQLLPGGDHSILVGRLENVTLTGDSPLIHYRRDWHRPSALPTHRTPDAHGQLV